METIDNAPGRVTRLTAQGETAAARDGIRRRWQVRSALAVAAVAAATVASSGAAAASTARLNPRLYPNPVPPKRGGWSLSSPSGHRFMCPNPEGLEAVSRVSTATHNGAITAVEGVTESKRVRSAEIFADRAGWTLIRYVHREWRKQRFHVQRAATFPTYSTQYQRACGKGLITASVVVSPRDLYADQTPRYYVLQRHGKWLFWGVQGG